MKLPTYADSHTAVELGLETPLERFIYEYELDSNDREWRKHLEAALNYWRDTIPTVEALDYDTAPLPFLKDDPE